MRKHNFYPGPSVLPVPVLEELRDTMLDFHGRGLSLMETSHRSAEYDEVHAAALSGVRTLLGVPESHAILFVGGGATLQFGMVPMNLLAGLPADIVVSGSWGKKALADIKAVGKATVVWNGSDSKFTTLPAAKEVKPSPGASYLHITTNETIEGLQWKEFPETGDVPLVADMSSDIMSRRIDVSRFGLIYAGAQKNLGPAGVTVVIVRQDLMDRVPESVPAYLQYKTHAKSDSLYNTPPVFAVYALSLVLKWITAKGGLDAVARTNVEKAAAVYRAIDESSGFYRCPVDPKYRSTMNVVFRLPSEELEGRFITGAEERGMVGLPGHRSVGGCRASLYNALPPESARALADWMREFARQNG